MAEPPDPADPLLAREELVGFPFLDLGAEPPRIRPAYVPADMEGIDLTDPQTARATPSASRPRAALRRAEPNSPSFGA